MPELIIRKQRLNTGQVALALETDTLLTASLRQIFGKCKYPKKYSGKLNLDKFLFKYRKCDITFVLSEFLHNLYYYLLLVISHYIQ